MEDVMSKATATNSEILERLQWLYHEMFAHDGYADLRVEMRILRRGQKEVIIHCGKQYRYVVDFEPGNGVAEQSG
ncbi:MAG: hypothetical protein U5S82_18665 [Gammaproteobacteria bacterium]|nr:hypothetical protein [Gammaproteobacteria bacterium]